MPGRVARLRRKGIHFVNLESTNSLTGDRPHGTEATWQLVHPKHLCTAWLSWGFQTPTWALVPSPTSLVKILFPP